jgi:hypothetical protein
LYLHTIAPTMKRTLFMLTVAALVCFAGRTAVAQVPVVTYYQPTTVFSPVVTPAPVVAPAPVTVVAPAPVVQRVYSPVVVESAPVISTQVVGAPVVAAPVPVTTYYRAPVVTMQATPQVVTRYRPILGGSVSRVRNVWAPAVW